VLAFGHVVNPLLFVPLAWRPQVTRNAAYRVMLLSFSATSAGLAALAIHALLWMTRGARREGAAA
jgi:hypothetical protein